MNAVLWESVIPVRVAGAEAFIALEKSRLAGPIKLSSNWYGVLLVKRQICVV